MNKSPEFPLKIYFKEDSEEWILNDSEEVVCNLEWFNSDDPSEKAVVTDNLGRKVRLKVEKLELLLCELE